MLSSGGGVWDDIPSFDTVAAEWKPRGETLTSASVHARYSGGGGYAEKLELVKEAPRTKKVNENSGEDDFFSFKDEAIASLKRTSTDHEFKATFPSPGIYVVSATCEIGNANGVTSSDPVVRSKTSHSDYIDCRYVRRELRELTDADRDIFLDAFMVLSRVETQAGVHKYGKHYRSLIDFELMHLKAAGDKRLDHIHDGVGLLTQHASMSSEMELSLQSVTPTIALPYWDYTFDSVSDYSIHWIISSLLATSSAHRTILQLHQYNNVNLGSNRDEVRKTGYI